MINGAASWPPGAPLLKAYKGRKVTWDEFVREYKKEIDTDAGLSCIEKLRFGAASSDVTLLCYEPEGVPCHRHILSEIILDPEKLHTSFEPKYTDHRERVSPNNIPDWNAFGGSFGASYKGLGTATAPFPRLDA